MSGPADASARLHRAIIGDARRAGVDGTIADACWTPWASVTFSGARHTMTLAVSDTQPAMDWLAALPETEFTLSGHLVADLIVGEGVRTADGIAVALEALTVES